MERTFSLQDVSRLLGLKAYRIQYAIVHGLVPEPKLRVSNRRIFQEEDVQRLTEHFAGQKTQDESAAVPAGS